MAVNPFYNFHSSSGEQNLIESLIIESIKQYGMDMRYLPRSAVALDNVYGEDVLEEYNNAASLEMYIQDFNEFGGEGDFLSKFGLEIRDNMTLTVAQKRFDQIRTEKVNTELGFNFQLENESGSMMYEGGDGYSIQSSRPLEGDLIYIPLTKKLYEIKFVEHEAIFYQAGKLQTYDLKVELFEYSSQTIDTGEELFDGLEDENTLSISDNALSLENGDNLILEDGSRLLQEYSIEENDKQADNDTFQKEASKFMDFSEHDPYGDSRF